MDSAISLANKRPVRILTPVPKHSELLKISQDSRKIEEILNEKLTSLISSIQKLEKQDQIFLANDYTEKINTSIRRSVELIYQIAGNYAANFTSREYYTTRSDLDAIQRISQNYIDLFNQRISRFVNTDTEQNRQRPEFIVKMTTSSLTQETMRAAIISKSQQILTPVITTAALDDEVQVVYVWVTSRDDKVCPICSGYEGQAWPYEESFNIPEIPDDTHPNCRCVLQLAEAEFL